MPLGGTQPAHRRRVDRFRLYAREHWRCPILLLLWAPVLAAQAVVLPVVAFSTAGYVHYGSVDFVLGTVQIITNESFDSMKNFLALS